MRWALAFGLALVVMSTASACAGAYAEPGPEGVLRFGSPLSLTGALAADGQETQQGYQYCQDVVNERGGVVVGGRHLTLRISYEDDQSSPMQSAEIAQQFNDQGIKFLLGPYGSEANATVAAIAQITGQVMVDTAGADNEIFAHGYRRVFGMETPAPAYAASLIRAILANVHPAPASVAIASANDNFSLAVAYSAIRVATAAGLHVFPLITFPEGSTNLSSVVIQLRADHASLVIESGHFVEGAAFVQQAALLGLHPDGIGEVVAPTDRQFVQTLGTLANGVLSPTQWTPAWSGHDKYFGTAADYARGFKARFGFMPDYHVAEASAGCLALVLAVEHAGTTNPDAVAVALSRLNVSSFFGQIRFGPKGQPENRQMAVIQIQHGQPVTVWPPDLAQAHLVWPATSAP